MLTVRVGKPKMVRQQKLRKWFFQCLLIVVPLAILITFILQNYSQNLKDWHHALDFDVSISATKAPPPKPDDLCPKTIDCPEDHFSFFIQSGAAKVVPPKMCLQHKLVLGAPLNNAGVGINIVVVNGKTGDIIKAGSFDMYSGDVKPLIELLKSIEHGSVVLMASYDEPSSKLNKEARKLIAELGSSVVHSLGFRDNWVFVGGKGATAKSNFEKHMKNNKAKNKYENWPELVRIQGCIPKYME